jgi:nucleoside-diphosphate-sugar epimerase
MKSEVEFIEDTDRLRPKNSEVLRLWGDNKKLKELTGFSIDYSLEKGLEETINWFVKPENLAKYNRILILI